MTLAELLVKFGVDISAVTDGLSQMLSEVEKASNEAEKKWSGLKNVGQDLMTMGVALSAAVTAPLVGLGAAAVSMSEQLNMARISFETMLGSAQKAKVFLDALKDFAAKTPFEFPDLVEAAKRMLAMGFSAEQVIPTLRSVGDAGAALGANKEVINGITLALGQMQAKGKVSAQEMNQLAERGIPAWQFLADKIGVTVPEAMKMAESGAIRAAQAIPAILEGMNEKFGGQMEKAAQTLTGTWSNFKDTLGYTIAEIGKTLTPILKTIVDAAMPLLDWAKQAAQWFANLPAPVQNAVIAFTALAAAVGPVVLAIGGIATAVGAAMPALAGIAAFFGTSVVALGGWALAIAGVVAALVALGTWVYQNWAPIVAVLRQAWDGITEMWHAVWDPVASWLASVWDAIAGLARNGVFGPLLQFFIAYWGPIKDAFIAAWNGIGSFLSSVWSGIKSAASAIWNGIVSVFQTFLEWAAKIPGVNKLMNLDEAWASAKKLEEQTKKTAEATENHAKAATKLTTEHKKLTPALDKTKTGTEGFGKATREASGDFEVLIEMFKIETQRRNDAVRKLAEHKLAIEKANSAVVDYTEGLDELNKTIAESIAANLDLKPPLDEYVEALKAAGITSTATFNQMAADASALYEAIANDPRATQWEKDNAMLRMLKAQAEAMRANSTQIPADMQKTMEGLEAKVSGKMPDVQKPFDDFKRNVNQSIADLSTDMVKSLFEGDLSFADKGIKALKGLGEAVATQFITPATTAISSFISTTLSDLLSGKGLGGILDSLKNIGSAIGGIFGGAGKAAGAAGGVAGSAGSAGSAAGGIGGAIGGGVMGSIGAIGSAVSAVSGVIGNFQNAHMETSLNAIEHNTRYTMMYVGERADGGILGVLFKTLEEISWGVQTKAVEASRDKLATIAAEAPRMVEWLGNIFLRLGEFQNDFRAWAGAGGAVAAGAGGGSLTVNVYVQGTTTDPERLGESIVSGIRRASGGRI